MGYMKRIIGTRTKTEQQPVALTTALSSMGEKEKSYEDGEKRD
jgi:hypothetical protein